MNNRIYIASIISFFLFLSFFSLAQPVNDNCTSATLLNSNKTCTPTKGDLFGATKTVIGTSTQYNDVWYSFVAVTNTHFVSLQCDDDLRASWEYFTGNCTAFTSKGTYTLTGTNQNVVLTLTNLVIGQTYYYRIYNTSTSVSNTFYTCVEDFIPNDNCATAVEITPGISGDYCNSTLGKTLAATATSPSINACPSTTAEDDVWYVFKATNPIHFITLSGNTNFNGVMQIFTSGSSMSCSSMTPLDCVNNALAGKNEVLSKTDLVVGNWYYIRIYDSGASASSTPYFGICVTTPPPNDDCMGAKEIKVGSTCTQTSGEGSSATLSIPASNGFGNANDDMWYYFTAEKDIEIISVSATSEYDPIIQVYASNCPSNSTTPFYTNDVNYPKGGFGLSTVTGLTTGQKYYYRIYDAAAINGSSMAFSTCVVNPASNDNCNNAKKLNPSYTCTQVEGNGTYASESNPAKVNATTANDDVWYSFEATENSYFITVNASYFVDPVVEVFLGCPSSNSVAPIYMNDATFPSNKVGIAKITTTTPGTYYYRIYDAGSGKNASMSFTTCVTRRPKNDECSDAIQVYTNQFCSESDSKYATESMVKCAGNTNAANDDVWFKFTAQATKQFISVNPIDPNFDPVVQVFSTCGTSPTPFPSSTASCLNSYPTGISGSAVIAGLSPNSTYYYRVYDLSESNQDKMTFTTCVSNVVSNDECAGATEVKPGEICNAVEGNGLHATESIVKCIGNNGAANDDVWFKFTATNATQFISVSPDDSKFDPVVQVFTGCGTTPTPMVGSCFDSYPSGSFGTSIVKNLTKGQTYYYRVYDISPTNQDTTTFKTCVVEPIKNDNCENAILIVPGDVCNLITGDGTYASESMPTCTGTSGSANDDVWFKFVASRTSENITIEAPKGYNPVVQLFSACGSFPFPNVGSSCNDAAYSMSSFGNAQVTNLIPNTTYYYRVFDNSTTNVYPMEFKTCVAHEPENNECSNAIDVIPNSGIWKNGEGTYATESINTTENCSGTANDDVWFKFRPTASQQLIYVNPSADYDPVVQVYSSCGSNNPIPFPTALSSCSDSRYPIAGIGSWQISGLNTSIDYYYRVYDKGNGTSTTKTFITTVTSVPSPPINDEPCKAILLTPSINCNFSSYSNESATTSTIIAPSCGGYSGGDIWFKVKVPFSEDITIETKALSMLDGGMAIYKGSCNSMTLLNCNNDNGVNPMPKINQKTNISASDTIWIRIWENGNDNNGTFEICVTKAIEAPLVGSCANLGFDEDLSSWYGTTGSVNIGAVGAMSPIYKPTTVNTTSAANQFNLMTSGIDKYGLFPIVYKGKSSLRLGYESNTNNGRSIEQYFTVGKSNASFTYNYAAVLNTGVSANHGTHEQPFFKTEFFDDNGNQISCGDYLVVAPPPGNTDKIGFIPSATKATNGDVVFYKPWTSVTVDLSNYIGKSVHVRFTTGSCSQNAHFGYVYLDCSCSPFEIIKPASICIGDSATLYAPKGCKNYQWKNKLGSLLGSKDSLIVKGISPGVSEYSCEITLFGTSLCATILKTEVEVKATPTIIISTPAPVCAPMTIDITKAEITSGSTTNLTYSYWKNSSSNQVLTKKTAIDSSGTFYIKGERSPTCFEIKPIVITINPTPIVKDTSITLCSNNTFDFVPKNSIPNIIPPNTKYTWTVENNPSVSGESNQSTLENRISITTPLINNSNVSQLITYTITPISGDCAGIPFKLFVTLNPMPFIASKNGVICSGSTFTLTPTNSSPDIVPADIMYTWNTPSLLPISSITGITANAIGVSSISQTLINNTNASASANYVITATSGSIPNACSSTFQMTVIVNPKPKITDITKTICSGDSISEKPLNLPLDQIIPTDISYGWTLPIITPANTISNATALSNQLNFKQLLKNTSSSLANAEYTITATSGAIPNVCSTSFKIIVKVNPILSPIINCGNSTTTSVTFNWNQVLNTDSYDVTVLKGGLSSLTNLNSTSLTVSGALGEKIKITVSPKGSGCFKQDTLTCNVKDCPSPTITKQPENDSVCEGTAAVFNAIGASTDISGVTYQWQSKSNGGPFTNVSNGTEATLTISNTTVSLSETEYQVIVTEKKTGACKITSNTVKLIVIPTPISNPVCTQSITCSQADVTLNGSTSTSGATYVYKWTGGPAGATITNPSATSTSVNKPGTYTLEVKEKNIGCFATKTVTVAIDTLRPTANAGTEKTLSCAATSVSLDGSASSTGASITYLWTGPSNATISSPNASSTDVTKAGTYTLKVTNTTNGCSNSDDVLVKTDNSIPTATAGLDTLFNCSRKSIILNGNGSATGPTISYKWTGGDAGATISNSTTLVPTIDKTGTYRLTVSNTTNGCSDFDEMEVSIDTISPSLSIAAPETLTCVTTTVDLNASASSAGNQYVYNWTSSDATATITNGSSSIARVNKPANYTLKITNTDNGCVKSKVVAVSQNITAPNAKAGEDKVLTCAVTELSLDGSASSSGSNFSYDWTSNSGTLSAPNDQSPTIDKTGTYTILVSDKTNGCTSSDIVIVTENLTPPTVSAGPDKILTCSITSIALDGSASATSASATYLWTASDSQATITSTTSQSPTVNKTGTYTLVVKDKTNGCTASEDVIVTIDNSAPTANAGSNKMLTCAITSIALDGSASSQGADFAYSWTSSNVGATITTTTSNSPTVNKIGTYTLKVTSAKNGCSATSTVEVTQDIALPLVVPTVDGLLSCAVKSVTLDAGVSSSGPSFSYQWSGVTGATYSAATAKSSRVDLAGVHTLTITNADNGCSNSGSVTVVMDNTLPTATALGTIAVCIDAAKPQIAFNGANGVGPYTFEYTLNGSNQTPVTSSTATTFTLDAPTNTAGTFNYIITKITDSRDAACTRNISGEKAIVTVKPIDTTIITIGTRTLKSVTFTWNKLAGANAYQVAEAINPTSTNINYLAVSSNNIICTTTSCSYTRQGLAEGDTVYLSVTGIGGCFERGRASTSALICTRPIISLDPTSQQKCSGATITLNANATSASAFQWEESANGGVSWSTIPNTPPYNGTTSATLTISDITGLNAYAYRLKAIEPMNACPVYSKIAVITAFPLPNAQINSNPATTLGKITRCVGDTMPRITFMANAGLAPFKFYYSINAGLPIQTNPPTDKSTTLKVTTNTPKTEVYNLTEVEDANGCKQKINLQPITIIVYKIPEVKFVSLDTIGCKPYTVKLTDVSTDAPFDKIKWDFGDGATSEKPGSVTHTYNSIGDFTIRANVSLNGCLDTTIIQKYIHVTNKPVADFSVNPNILSMYDTKVVLTNLSHGEVNFYRWSFGDGSPISNLKNPIHTYLPEPGNYVITLTAYVSERCNDVKTQIITIPEDVVYFIPNTFTPNGDEKNNTFQPIFSSGYDPQNYQFLIYNRWGEIIFESHNTEIGWDGTYRNKLSQNDTYTWKLQFKEKMADKEHLKTGHVNLVK